jgi:cytochrome c-type biogenesis protein CcmH
MLWFVFALVTLATLAVLLWPMLRVPAPLGTRTDYDLGVYRAQLAELDADTARGLIASDAAAAARTEIQRRMLAATPSPAPADDRTARKTAAIVIAVTLPLAAVLLYMAYGHPRLPGAPYAERLQHEPAVILADAGAKMETQLAAKPSIAGYRRLAEFYLRTNDVAHAAAAQKRAMQLGADSAADWADLGEIAVIAAQGAVGPDALANFAQALRREPREPRARFYVGLAEAEIGHARRAVAIWRDLERDSKPDAPWLPVVRRQIDAVSKAGKFDPATVPPEAPSAAMLDQAVAAMANAMSGPAK